MKKKFVRKKVAFRIKPFFQIESVFGHIYLSRWTIVSHSDEKKYGSIKRIEGDQFLARTSRVLGSSRCQLKHNHISEDFLLLQPPQIYVKGLQGNRKLSCCFCITSL